MLRRVVERLPAPLQRALYRGGRRSDRLRDADAVVAALSVRPGDRVADLGPGYGHFTLRLARAVAPDGVAYAVDADAETLDDLRRAADERGITNVRPVLTSRRRLELPEPVDLLFVSATYHHLRRPVRYFAEACSRLRPGGRVVILESRLEGVAARWMNPHGSVPSRVHAEMILAGYELVETHDINGHWFAMFTHRREEEAMTHERTPERERSLVSNDTATTSWELARERLANPEVPRTYWLATTRPDGGPHLMPVIGFWIDGAMHVVAGERTRKARNLEANGRCAIATGSTALPSLDIVIEGVAEPLRDEDAVRQIAEFLISNNWPVEAKGDKVYGPHAPTAGPPPYTIFRIVPSRVFGLPGMYGMEQFDPADLPRPTRWDFGGR